MFSADVVPRASAAPQALTGAPAGAGDGTGAGARLRRMVLPVATTAAVLAVAEAASRTGVVPEQYFPPVTSVVAELLTQASGQEFWRAVGQTLLQAAIGLGIAVAIAVPLGMLTGLSRLADDLTAYVVELLRPVPSVALIPLAILIVGTDRELAVVLVAFAATWPLLLQTRYGLRAVDPTALDTARVLGLPPLARLRWVLLPSAAAHIATGLRLSASLAIILSITAQLVAGAPGLGRSITLAQSAGDQVTMYAYIAATGLLGLLVSIGVSTAERRLLAWHPSHRAEAGR